MYYGINSYRTLLNGNRIIYAIYHIVGYIITCIWINQVICCQSCQSGKNIRRFNYNLYICKSSSDFWMADCMTHIMAIMSPYIYMLSSVAYMYRYMYRSFWDSASTGTCMKIH